MSAWKTTFYLFAVPSVAFIVSLISFYIQATKILGHSPTYGRPDPKELYIYMDYAPVVNLAAGAWLFAFPAWLILSVVYMIYSRKDIRWVPLVVSALANLLALRLLFSGIFDWYID